MPELPGDGDVQFLRSADPGAPRSERPTETVEPGDSIGALDIGAIEPDAPGLSLVPAPRPERLDLEPEDKEIRKGDVDAWGRSESLRALARKAYDPLYKYWFRAEWEGLEHIPTEGGALLIANHAAAIPSDAPVIMHGIEKELGRAVYGLAENLFRAVPVVGTLWARGGGVAAHPENAYRLLREQRQLALVFPEGSKGPGKHFSQRYRLRRFGRGGFVEAAMRAQAPIVPICVVGAEEAAPVFAQIKVLQKLTGLLYFPITPTFPHFGLLGMLGYLPAKFRIRFLEPIYFDDEGMYRDKSLVQTVAQEVRSRIQEGVWQMVGERQSVWFG